MMLLYLNIKILALFVLFMRPCRLQNDIMACRTNRLAGGEGQIRRETGKLTAQHEPGEQMEFGTLYD